MERVHAIGPDGYFHGAPELAIEIVSPSETARTLLQKIRALRAAGSLAVWVIFSDECEVRVFLPDGTPCTSGLNATLSIPELPPGWELPVARLFENC